MGIRKVSSSNRYESLNNRHDAIKISMADYFKTLIFALGVCLCVSTSVPQQAYAAYFEAPTPNSIFCRDITPFSCTNTLIVDLGDVEAGSITTFDYAWDWVYESQTIDYGNWGNRTLTESLGRVGGYFGIVTEHPPEVQLISETPDYLQQRSNTSYYDQQLSFTAPTTPGRYIGEILFDLTVTLGNGYENPWGPTYTTINPDYADCLSTYGSAICDAGYFPGIQGTILLGIGQTFPDCTIFTPGEDCYKEVRYQVPADETYYYDVAIWANVLAPAAVHIPATLWLFGSGLLGLVGMARRKQAA
jgi:hypothetical protein